MPKVLPMTYETLKALKEDIDAVESAYLLAVPSIPKRSPYLPLGDKLMSKEITVLEYIRLRGRLIKFYTKNDENFHNNFGGAV